MEIYIVRAFAAPEIVGEDKEKWERSFPPFHPVNARHIPLWAIKTQASFRRHKNQANSLGLMKTPKRKSGPINETKKRS